MKKRVLFLAVALALTAGTSYGQLRIGGRSINLERAAQAASDLATAVTLSDEDIATLSREAVEWMDANNPVAEPKNEYAIRLARLTEGLDAYRGVPLNFKVYLVTDINAFACGDGSVRVFAALMDVMTDDELIGIIGHEIGHVYATDVKDAMKNAYLTSAALNAAGAAGGRVGQLSDSQAGELVSAFTEAQFSQAQEFAADDFGFRFCIDRGADPYGMALSLEKLVGLSSGAQASAVQKMFSSHPDSQNRAARVRQRADQYVGGQQNVE